MLLEAVLQYLSPGSGESYLDLTAGYGGHAQAVLERTQSPGEATLVDRDSNAVAALERFADAGAAVMHSDFYSASRELAAKEKRYDIILADLGVSSPHLDNASRGFAFSTDGPLDMRMDQRQDLTAETVVNTYSAQDLTEIFRAYGEEPRAATIAAAIVSNRPLKTTNELAELIRSVMPKGSKLHPATRAFQGLRIAVNDELELLRKSLPLWLDLLAPKGRLGIISFHSLEDRLVKQFLQEHSGQRYDAELSLLTKRPITADRNELFFNPRARSAKFRAAVKK